MSFAAIAMISTATMAAVSWQQGQQQQRQQKKALRDQKRAQKLALGQAVGQEKLSAMEMAKASKKKPKIPSLLSQERLRASQGPGATMLTGAGGGGGGKALLGSKTSLMGGY